MKDEGPIKPKDEKQEEEFWGKVDATIKYAGAMKRNMQKKGLKRAKAKCPHCPGYWHATISDYNGHMHMRCDGTCDVYFME